MEWITQDSLYWIIAFLAALFVGLLIRRWWVLRQIHQERLRQETKEAPTLKEAPLSLEIPKKKEPEAVSAPPRGLSLKNAIASWIPLLEAKSKNRDQWEEVLISSDMGPRLVDQLLDELQQSSEEPGKFFELKLKTLLRPARASDEPWKTHKPWVCYIVGVNGVGKTTSVVKLGRYLKDQKLSVGVIGADTFRKAAIEQLERQCEANGLEFFTRRVSDEQAEGVDPSSVIFDGLQKLASFDVILVDTSGRLHNKKNLMEELKKMKRVGSKVIEGAPQDVWLVLDATLGQNALSQARSFHEAVELSGLIMTKLDGLSRGGIVFQIFQDLGCPIRFIGVGERAQDFQNFDPDEFVEALFGEKRA